MDDAELASRWNDLIGYLSNVDMVHCVDDLADYECPEPHRRLRQLLLDDPSPSTRLLEMVADARPTVAAYGLTGFWLLDRLDESVAEKVVVDEACVIRATWIRGVWMQLSVHELARRLIRRGSSGSQSRLARLAEIKFAWKQYGCRTQSGPADRTVGILRSGLSDIEEFRAAAAVLPKHSPNGSILDQYISDDLPFAMFRQVMTAEAVVEMPEFPIISQKSSSS